MAKLLAGGKRSKLTMQEGTPAVSGIERLLYVACAQKKKLHDHAFATGRGETKKPKSLDLYPMHKQLGALLEASGLLPEARAHFKAALTIRPLDIGALLVCAVCCSRSISAVFHS